MNLKGAAAICWASMLLAVGAKAEFSIDEQFITRGTFDVSGMDEAAFQSDTSEALPSNVAESSSSSTTSDLASVASESDSLTVSVTSSSQSEEIEQSEVTSVTPDQGDHEIIELEPFVDHGHYVVRGDTLRVALPDIAQEMSYTRVLIDFPGQSALLGEAQSLGGRVSTDNLTDLEADLKKVFEGIEGVRVYAALDGDHGAALVVSTRTYNNPNRLRVFEVKDGSLRDNATRLAEEYNWRVPQTNGWQLSVDYTVSVSYPIVVSGIAEGFHRLFRQYPVQAQLIDGHQSAVFVSRTLPLRGEQ